MSGPESDRRGPVSLPVTASNAKLEQLRKEVARDGDAPPINTQSLIDRAVDDTLSPEMRAIRERVIDALRTVFDPEIPVNIYDLGLIYRIAVEPCGAVTIDMTLTAPACPVADDLVRQVRDRAAAADGVSSAVVNLVWEPPWSKDRMSEAALLELGLL